jgi:transposase-like protein
MKRPYQIVTNPSKVTSRELAEFLAKDGQFLLPLVKLLERGETAIDAVIDVMGRATVEAVLRMSAEQLAGPKTQGRRDDDRDLYWHGSQPGRVALLERQLRVDKPRLRRKKTTTGECGEVAIPAYTAMQGDQRLADRMLAIMMNGVSTRRYEKVLPEMAEQVGISKSEVSRETIEAGTRVLQELAERDFSTLDVLVIYLDGIQFGEYHVLAAVGVDEAGKKHVLGVRSGASENATVTLALLEDLTARGLRPDRRRLFVIDGAKALRRAIVQVFGAEHEIQRCRNHTLRNVVGHLPKEQHDQARATLRAAWKLEAKDGTRKLEQYASWLERDWPDAAASIREGLDEMFTVNRLGLPSSLRKCLTTTNIIDSTHAGIRQRTRRVTNWKNGEMALRWSATAFMTTEKNYRRVTGHDHLWMLKAHLDRDDKNVAEMQKVG